MNTSDNKFLSVSYKLYSVNEQGMKNLEEETQQGRPFQFITGFGFSLDAFEQRISQLEQGQKFDFTLTPDEAFGAYEPEGVHKMKREAFMVNGKFDDENIYAGAIITLMDADEKRFMARVTAVDADSVTVDTNHPLAGMTLQFEGDILENRPATNEEIQQMIKHMSHGCGHCGGGCDGDCDEDGCGGGGCGGGCGHCH